MNIAVDSEVQKFFKDHDVNIRLFIGSYLRYYMNRMAPDRWNSIQRKIFEKSMKKLKLTDAEIAVLEKLKKNVEVMGILERLNDIDWVAREWYWHQHVDVVLQMLAYHAMICNYKKDMFVKYNGKYLDEMYRLDPNFDVDQFLNNVKSCVTMDHKQKKIYWYLTKFNMK